MGKKNKNDERRKKNLEYIKNLYKNQEAEKEMYSKALDGSAKSNSTSNSLMLKTSYTNKDLRNLVILTLALVVVSIAMYYYDQSTNFLANLANNMLKDIVK
ncbi:MAG: hypothetical protein PHN19_05215 [Patescibacteria group bacterium]|nr:hypothetical protein [Patescibacteria group bacterium]